MIYILLPILGIISALSEKIIKKRNISILEKTIVYSVIYFWTINVIRAITSNPGEFLSYSLSDKGMTAYIKICILVVFIYIGITLIDIVIGKRIKDRDTVEKTMSAFSTVFSSFYSLYIVLIAWPTIKISVVIGVLAIIVTFVYIFHHKDGGISYKGDKDKFDVLCLIVAFLAYDMLFILAGPTELMAYNAGDFVYSYSDIVVYLLMGAILVSLPTAVMLYKNASKSTIRVYSILIMAYCILCYIQSMFLNGKMLLIDGSVQRWETKQIVINLVVWIAVLIVTLIISYRVKNGFKIIMGVCSYIAAIQLITFVFIILTSGDLRGTNKHLVQEGIFDLSDSNNVVVFILDAYDVQMLKTVVDNDPTYLEPLQDFIYFDNMESRYPMTDGSLPYLLTGADLNDPLIEEDQNKWYEHAHFLDDIKAAGYDIRILTSDEYVEKISDGVIDNYSGNTYCRLDSEKVLELFTRCMRYKCLPLLAKNVYEYEAYDTTNIILDTNVYVFGTDPEFDDEILEGGITSKTYDKAFRIYHLYGAHSPYYLNENADRDYGSNALSQWKGSLKLVYDYIGALKTAGIYDNTTLIIMADHGFNNTQRISVREEGIEFDETRSNPIFFIKKKGMSGTELKTDDRTTSHDRFFDTIYESMDIPLQYYGTVFE